MELKPTSELPQILEALETLQREVTRLSDRMAALETILPEPVRESVSRFGDTAKRAPISEELVAAISAAIAAYLGVQPRIRQIRLLRSDSWAQQGRVTIQASHTLSVHHG